MNTIKLLTISCLLVVTVIGCQHTLGPKDYDSIPSYMAKALPESDNKPIINGYGMWEPNMRGFATLKENFYNKSSSRVGIGGIAITDSALYFGEWQSDETRYVLAKRIFLKDLNDIIIETYGANICFAIQSKDLSWDTFSYSGKVLVDKVKTKEAYVFIKSKIK